MMIKKHPIAILSAGRGDSMNIGVAQIRQAERGRIVREGAVALVLMTAEGEQIDVLITPDEAMTVGPQIIASACAAAAQPPPMIGDAGAVRDLIVPAGRA